MAVDKTLISGSVTMLLLKLLSKKVHSMEEKDLVTAYEQEVLGKVRKYYRLTKEGKKVLKNKEEEWKEYTQAVANVMVILGV